MRRLVGPVPEPGERACSALRRCARASLSLGVGRPSTVSLAHHVPDTADVWLAIPMADTEAITRGGVAARLEVLDVIPGGVAEGRCRRVVVVAGWVELPGTRAQHHAATRIAEDLPDATLLGVGHDTALVRLRAATVVLADHDGVTDIDPDDLATSGPDPFTDIEGHWLNHLNDPRCDIVPRLALRVCRCQPARRPLLVGIDRAGVDLEYTDRDDTVRRHRLPFDEECVDPAQLATRIRVLANARYPSDRAALRP